MMFARWSIRLYTPNILLLALILAALGLDPVALLGFIATLCALWSLSSSLQSTVEMLGAGRLFSIFVVPWLTTFPETLTTVLLARAGYTIAGLFNGIFSAVFDLFLVLPLLARGFTLSSWFVFGLLLVIPPFLAVFLPDLVLAAWWEGALLVALCIVLTLLPVVFTHEVIVEKKVELTPSQLITTIIGIVSGAIALVFTTWQFTAYVEALCEHLSQEIAGILSAYLTSLPDAVYALVLREQGEVEESIGEIWACVIHDYTENLGFAALFGGKIIVSMTDVILSILVILALTVTLLVSYLRNREYLIDNMTAALLISLFITFTILGIVL